MGERSWRGRDDRNQKAGRKIAEGACGYRWREERRSEMTRPERAAERVGDRSGTAHQSLLNSVHGKASRVLT